MKHLLSINDIDKDFALTILDTAAEMAKVSEGPVKKLPTLRGKTVVNLFAEDSTRTRISLRRQQRGYLLMSLTSPQRDLASARVNLSKIQLRRFKH